MKPIICAECGKIIEDEYLTIGDNYLQLKYFEEVDGSDNIFCSDICILKNLNVRQLYVEGLLTRKEYLMCLSRIKEVKEKMKDKMLTALESIKRSYDAYYFLNQCDYSKNTHKKEFDLLRTLQGEKVEAALDWITTSYDCHYADLKTDFIEAVFSYLRKLIMELEE